MSIVISRRHRLDLAERHHQQCWCWGCDIKRSDGNLLCRYGARRVPPDVRRRDCSTAYHVVYGDDTRIALWGFGLAFVPHDGLPLLLRRYDPTPLVLGETDGLERVWSPQALPPATHAETAPVW